MTVTTPDISLGDLNSLPGTFKVVISHIMKNMQDCIPAKVISYDRSKNRAMIQPLIDVVLTNGDILQRAPIASVPVYRFSGGGTVFSVNLQSGDCGWLKANDRDISIFKEYGGQSIPNTKRKHTFEDAMFFPDLFSEISTNQEHVNDATIQTRDGSSSIGFMGSNYTHKVSSTTKAAMPYPRMTTIQRDLIPTPEEGMFIWNLDTSSVNVFNGVAWV